MISKPKSCKAFCDLLFQKHPTLPTVDKRNLNPFTIKAQFWLQLRIARSSFENTDTNIQVHPSVLSHGLGFGKETKLLIAANVKKHLTKCRQNNKYSYTLFFIYTKEVKWNIILVIYLIRLCPRYHHLMYNGYKIIKKILCSFSS